MKKTLSKFSKPVTTIILISLLGSLVMSFGLIVERGACDQSTVRFFGVEIYSSMDNMCVGGNKEVLIGGVAPYSLGCSTCTPIEKTASEQTNQALTIGTAYLSSVLLYMTLFLTLLMLTYWTANQMVRRK